jgi:dUTP pyrophosphatase
MKMRYLSQTKAELAYATEHSAGLDVASALQYHIEPGETVKIRTGITLEIPESCFGMICSRSGLGVKEGLIVAQGVGIVDSDYRGELLVPIRNVSPHRREINIGQRIAQLIILPYTKVTPTVVDNLTETKRGAGGFGSTGK